MNPLRLILVSLLAAFTTASFAANPAEEKETLEVLFIGNSYTARHDLAKMVKSMAEAGNPDLTMNVTQVIYGGRRLVDHWRLGTANFVRLHELTEEEEKATIADLEAQLAKDPEDKYAKNALSTHRDLLKNLEKKRTTWDVIVLQSYKDDLDGAKSLYVQYAPRYAELAKAQGARVILYETTPETQNAEALTEAPDPAPILEKEKAIAALADEIGAAVAPMSMVALRCQTERPDLTLRFINDAHLNHTMSYMTACAIYAALFDRSPEGLPNNSVTDIRYWQNTDKTKDRDGQPITRTFSDKDRADMQRIVWESIQEFKKLRAAN